MSKQTEALKLALEALKELRMLGMNMQWHDSWLAKSETAITAIREALAEQPAQQEPVAWVREHELPLAPGDAFSWVETFVHKTPLYTSPPASKPWVGLTDEQIAEIAATPCAVAGSYVHTFARDIEAKLREKNNG